MQTIITITRISNAALLDARTRLDIVKRGIEGRPDRSPPWTNCSTTCSARREEDAGDWPSYARSCLTHPLRELLHQDPFTYRAFDKPRGYAGDAVMMDYIYGLGEAGQAAREATPLGRAIFRYMDTRPSAKAVRYRRRLLAGLIDRVAERGGAGVLAIAAGHLREVELSSAVQSGSAARVCRARPGRSQPLRGGPRLCPPRHSADARLGAQHPCPERSTRDSTTSFTPPGCSITSALPVAAALTRRMFDMTRPGGLMLIPNFLTGIRDVGYMESFMDWHLIYRTEADMWALASSLPKDAVADSQVFDDDVDTITYLLVSKAG